MKKTIIPRVCEDMKMFHILCSLGNAIGPTMLENLWVGLLKMKILMTQEFHPQVHIQQKRMQTFSKT